MMIICSIGDVRWFETEKKIGNTGIKENDILLWVQGPDKMSMIKKRGEVIRHVLLIHLIFSNHSAEGL